MTDQPIKKFLDRIQTQKSLDPVPKDNKKLTEYYENTSEFLQLIWDKVDFSGYEEGLWWLTPPDMLSPLISSIFPELKNSLVIGRTALADLFILTDMDKVSILNMRLKSFTLTKEDIDIFFNYLLTDEDFFSDMLDQELFYIARQKNGVVKHDECYGFLPTLAMGGSPDPGNLEKVKLMEHILILAQS